MSNKIIPVKDALELASENYKEYSINFVGSIAYYYRDVLEEAADAVDCKIGKILQAPMEGLIAYHA